MRHVKELRRVLSTALVMLRRSGRFSPMVEIIDDTRTLLVLTGPNPRAMDLVLKMVELSDATQVAVLADSYVRDPERSDLAVPVTDDMHAGHVVVGAVIKPADNHGLVYYQPYLIGDSGEPLMYEASSITINGGPVYDRLVGSVLAGYQKYHSSSEVAEVRRRQYESLVSQLKRTAGVKVADVPRKDGG